MKTFNEYFAYYPHFPKEGIVFIDILPLMSNRKAFKEVIDAIADNVTTGTVLAPEARAFLFASPLLACPGSNVQNVIAVRKNGKLPYNEGDLVEVEIEKEYGKDRLYYRLSDLANSPREDHVIEVSILDDILATGGTALGLAKSVLDRKLIIDGEEYSFKIKEFVFLVEILGLPGRDVLREIAPVHSLVKLSE